MSGRTAPLHERRVSGRRKPVNAGHDLAIPVEINDPVAQAHGMPVRQRVQRVTTQTILDRWLARRSIDERQWKAGDRLRETIYLAGLEPRVTVNLESTHGSGDPRHMMPTSEAQAAARAELRRTLALLPQRLAGLAVAVCADQETPEAYMAREGIKGSDAKTIGRDRLRMALDLLADLYGV